MSTFSVERSSSVCDVSDAETKDSNGIISVADDEIHIISCIQQVTSREFKMQTISMTFCLFVFENVRLNVKLDDRIRMTQINEFVSSQTTNFERIYS